MFQDMSHHYVGTQVLLLTVQSSSVPDQLGTVTRDHCQLAPLLSITVIEDLSCWDLAGECVEIMEHGHHRGYLSVVSSFYMSYVPMKSEIVC